MCSPCCYAELRATGNGVVRFCGERFDHETADLEGADLDYDTLTCAECGRWLSMGYDETFGVYFEDRALAHARGKGDEVDTLVAKRADGCRTARRDLPRSRLARYTLNGAKTCEGKGSWGRPRGLSCTSSLAHSS